MKRLLRHERLEQRLNLSAVGLDLGALVAAEVTTEVAAAVAGDSNDDLATPADVIHPNIHENNNAGQNANPNGANDGGGNMHGIGNVPGQNGVNPGDDGVAGFANQLNTVHGGIGTVNNNVGKAADVALATLGTTLDTAVTNELAEAVAGDNNDDLDTPADTIHPQIHQNNDAGQNANPNGANDGGGNMHGIANNPGQNNSNPNDDGVNGFANELATVHGGIGTVNQNA